ncbi:MAG: autotransporter outer membrane beta-barrel domain-containing protein [Puniceicoccales bacterium]|nr:autotransporter outer membrane beta-barrel domain-containing protein [Puniceicoccales bacterium]
MDFLTVGAASLVEEPDGGGARIEFDPDALALTWESTAAGTAHGNFTIAGAATGDPASNEFTLNYSLADRDPAAADAFAGWDGKTLSKYGEGTLTLAQKQRYTGETRVWEGVLKLTAADALENSEQVNVAEGAKLTAATDQTFKVLYNNGTVEIDGDITATGTTGTDGVVNQGTLTTGNITGSVGNADWATLTAKDITGSVVNAGSAQFGNVSGRVDNCATGTIRLRQTQTTWGTLYNDGTIDFVNAGRTLTITGNLDNYASTAGTRGTYLLDIAPAGNPSDLLVVQGDVAGTHHLLLRTGAYTQGELAGTVVLDAQNDDPATTSTISAETKDGAWLSTTPLTHENGQYKIAALPAEDDPGTGTGTGGGGGGDDTGTSGGDGGGTGGDDTGTGGGGVVDRGVEELRLTPEAGLLANITGTAALLWFDQLDNLRERLGALRGPDAPRIGETSLWLRGYASEHRVNLDLAGVPNQRAYIYGADVGGDHTFAIGGGNSTTGAGTTPAATLALGGYAGYQSAHRSFRGGPGSADTEAVNAGLYATYYQKSGFFVDIVAKFQRSENDYDAIYRDPATGAPYARDHGEYANTAAGFSIEIGQQANYANGRYFLEPTLQFAFAHLFAETFSTTDSVRVKVTDADLLRFGAAIRAGCRHETKSWGILEPSIQLGVEVQDTLGGALRITAPTTGTTAGNSYRVTPDTDGVRGTLSAALGWQLNDHWQLQATYKAALAEKYDTPWQVSASIRYRF